MVKYQSDSVIFLMHFWLTEDWKYCLYNLSLGAFCFVLFSSKSSFGSLSKEFLCAVLLANDQSWNCVAEAHRRLKNIVVSHNLKKKNDHSSTLYGKHPLTVQPSPFVPCGSSCNLHSGLNQICQACLRPVATALLNSESQHTYHLPPLSLTGKQGLCSA